MQKFLITPKYNKNYIYINLTILHQQFTNAYAYYCMVKTENLTYKKSDLYVESTKIWKEIKKNSEEEIKDQIKTYFATPILLHLQGFIQSRSSYTPQSPDPQPLNSTR
ncbi:12374_t:CDS:1 [Funneliformis mosseae]|uniref:12374_t:CDS:1 n=1 Tax=Funneliformis mosseae TaxID=27381 RepID=A0A9N8YJQ8_FUNMO|nr:12374_t:CDS:1 [Funneliformis mosseae]